jgi:quercetin dioxygenase-like cupin family protein
MMHTAADLHPGYAAPTCFSTGNALSARFAPSGFSLWLVAARLEAGATLRWPGAHGDEGIYVVDGALTVDGNTCGGGGALIVEAGVDTEIRVETATELVHVGPAAAAPPSGGLLGAADPAGHGVHVIPAGDANAIEFGAFSQVSFADSTCPTCRIALFRVDGTDEPYVVGSHLHSEDEIIHVLSGALQVGPRTVAAGMSIAIPGGQRYGFRTNSTFSFLNYRADVSTVVTTPGSEPHIETVDALRQAIAQARQA